MRASSLRRFFSLLRRLDGGEGPFFFLGPYSSSASRPRFSPFAVLVRPPLVRFFLAGFARARERRVEGMRGSESESEAPSFLVVGSSSVSLSLASREGRSLSRFRFRDLGVVVVEVERVASTSESRVFHMELVRWGSRVGQSSGGKNLNSRCGGR